MAEGKAALEPGRNNLSRLCEATEKNQDHAKLRYKLVKGEDDLIQAQYAVVYLN